MRCCKCRTSNKTFCHSRSCECKKNQRACTSCLCGEDFCRNSFRKPLPTKNSSSSLETPQSLDQTHQPENSGANPELKSHRPETQASCIVQESLAPVVVSKKNARCCGCRASNKTFCHSKSCECLVEKRPCTSCKHLDHDACKNKFNPPKVDAPQPHQSPPLVHEARDSNAGKTKTTSSLEKIKLPPAHAKAQWAVLEKELRSHSTIRFRLRPSRARWLRRL